MDDLPGPLEFASEPQFIETTAGEAAAERARRGVAAHQHVTITIEREDWLQEVRRYARPLVAAQGLLDADIDTLIEAERDAVQPHR